jgi:hypothetical protein
VNRNNCLITYICATFISVLYLPPWESIYGPSLPGRSYSQAGTPFRHLVTPQYVQFHPIPPPTMNPQAPSIKITNLNYKFPDGSTALNNINLDLPPGSRTLLIGGTSTSTSSSTFSNPPSQRRRQNHPPPPYVWQASRADRNNLNRWRGPI